jgi:hypothetical protein
MRLIDHRSRDQGCLQGEVGLSSDLLTSNVYLKARNGTGQAQGSAHNFAICGQYASQNQLPDSLPLSERLIDHKSRDLDYLQGEVCLSFSR